MMFWGILIAVFVLITVYAIWVRPWLTKQPWAQRFFAAIEPIEISLFKKSETILIGRLLWVGSSIVTFYDGLAFFVRSLDLTPLTTRIFDWLQIPPDLRSLSLSAFVGIIGLIINRLRKTTTKPLELVAVPAAKITPEVASTMAAAEEAKQEAVQAVAEAKP